MEEFIGIIVLIIYLFAAASSRKKKGKKQERQRQAKRTGRGADFESAFGSQRRSGVQSDENASVGEACSQQRIHLHEATQEQMYTASEGEDPCHEGSAPDMPEEPVFSYDEETVGQSAPAEDVLRGVIMSEILTRPCERAAIKRNGRSLR